MAEAEPVIRAVLPDANVPTSVRSSGVPVVHGSDVGPGLDPRHLARRARRRDRLRHRRSATSTSARPGPSRVRSLTPELSKGLEFDLVVLVDPETFGDRHRGSGRPLRRDDPGDPAAGHPHQLLTRACEDARRRSRGGRPGQRAERDVVGRFEGKRAVVTGAAGGVGQATVEMFASEGASVVGLDLNASDGVLACDVSDEGSVRTAVDAAAKQLGGLDIVVNVAGIDQFRKFEDLDVATGSVTSAST